jgi:hypothetical protein
VSYNRAIVDESGKVIFEEENPAFIKNSETIREGSLYGVVNLVADVPTPIRIGDANLAERHSVLIINPTASTIYVGLDDNVTSINGIPLASETERLLSVSPNESLTLYGFAKADVSIKVVEVK